MWNQYQSLGEVMYGNSITWEKTDAMEIGELDSSSTHLHKWRPWAERELDGWLSFLIVKFLRDIQKNHSRFITRIVLDCRDTVEVPFLEELIVYWEKSAVSKFSKNTCSVQYQSYLQGPSEREMWSRLRHLVLNDKQEFSKVSRDCKKSWV